MSFETTTLAEVVKAGDDSTAEHQHTAIIGIVDTYDITTQRANIVCAVRHPLLDEDGEPVYEDFPPFASVPVVWPRGANGGLHGALASGDSVLLVFLQTGIGEWRMSSGGTQNTADLRRHSEGYPVALAGIAPDAQPLASATPNAWELGYFGGAQGRIIVQSSSILLGLGASDFIALSSKVNTAIANVQSKLDSLISSYTAHQHASAAVGSPTTALPPGSTSQAGVTAVGSQATTASTLVKAL